MDEEEDLVEKTLKEVGISGKDFALIQESVMEKLGEKEICSKKKEYHYHRINLVITPEREAKLRFCMEVLGIDPSRKDQDVIWDIIDWMEPLLKFRNKLRDFAREVGLKETDLK